MNQHVFLFISPLTDTCNTNATGEPTCQRVKETSTKWNTHSTH